MIFHLNPLSNGGKAAFRVINDQVSQELILPAHNYTPIINTEYKNLAIRITNHCAQNGSGAHPASYPMGTGDSFPGGKAAGAWSYHSSTTSAEVKEWVELYLHSPNTSSWRGAQLEHRDNFTFSFVFQEYLF
jgi:hypothetical protein